MRGALGGADAPGSRRPPPCTPGTAAPRGKPATICSSEMRVSYSSEPGWGWAPQECKMRVCDAGPAWAKISRRCGAGYALVYAGPAVEVTALRHDGFLSQLQTNVALEVRVRGVDVALLSPLLGDIDLWSGRLRALREPGAPGNRRPAGLAARVRPRRHPRACRSRHEELLVSPRVTHRTRARAQTHLIPASPSARLFHDFTVSRSIFSFTRADKKTRRLACSATWGPEGFGSVVARSSGVSAPTIPSIALCVTRAPSDPRAPPKVSAPRRPRALLVEPLPRQEETSPANANPSMTQRRR